MGRSPKPASNSAATTWSTPRTSTTLSRSPAKFPEPSGVRSKFARSSSSAECRKADRLRKKSEAWKKGPRYGEVRRTGAPFFGIGPGLSTLSQFVLDAFVDSSGAQSTTSQEKAQPGGVNEIHLLGLSRRGTDREASRRRVRRTRAGGS